MTNRKLGLIFVILALASVGYVAYAAVTEGTIGHVTVVRYVNATIQLLSPDLEIAGVNVTDTVLETNVEWGLVNGTTGDWFNHSLPGEPVAILLEMHPTNLTYTGTQIVEPRVYDKDNYHWQLALYWTNGTQITTGVDLLVMYHMRYDPTNPTGNVPTNANPSQ